MRFPLEEGVLQPVLVVERALAAEPPYEESFLRSANFFRCDRQIANAHANRVVNRVGDRRRNG